MEPGDVLKFAGAASASRALQISSLGRIALLQDENVLVLVCKEKERRMTREREGLKKEGGRKKRTQKRHLKKRLFLSLIAF